MSQSTLAIPAYGAVKYWRCLKLANTPPGESYNARGFRVRATLGGLVVSLRLSQDDRQSVA